MKVKIEKGIRKTAVAKLFDNIFACALRDCDGDGIGNITMMFDVYKDGKKIDSKGIEANYIYEKHDKVVTAYERPIEEGEA